MRNMRHEMRESQMRMQEQVMMSARNARADKLIEKWSKTPVIGQGILDMAGKNLEKARGLAIVLENQENAMKHMKEEGTLISSVFGTTPENVVRIIRLAYPNSVRGELFREWAMETARDSIYYLNPVYGKTLRGATAGNNIYDIGEGDYPTEVMVTKATMASAVGTIASLDVAPIRPFTVKVEADGAIVGVDDGAGNLIGTGLDASAENTINYTTGATKFTLATVPTDAGSVQIRYNYDSEVEANFDQLGSVELQLKAYQFRAIPHPLYVKWTKMTELLLNTTLDIDAEEQLISAAADEIKKALDFQAVGLAYRSAKANTGVVFDCKQATGESEISRMTAFSKAIDAAGDAMLDEINRGGVTKLVGSPDAITKIKLHARFSAANRQPKVGIYREGSLDGIDVYKAPTTVIPSKTILAIYKNELQPEDVSVAFGTLIPLYRTQTLEHSNFVTETGLSNFGDAKVLNGKYLRLITLDHINNE